MAYSTDDKRKDLIYLDAERVKRVFAGQDSVIAKKLSISKDCYSRMSARKINAEWQEMMRPTEYDAGYNEGINKPTPKTDEEMAIIMKQSGKAGLMG